MDQSQNLHLLQRAKTKSDGFDWSTRLKNFCRLAICHWQSISKLSTQSLSKFPRVEFFISMEMLHWDLFLGSFRSNMKALILLLAHATSEHINATVSTRDLRSPLHLACACGNLAIAQLLIWVRSSDDDASTERKRQYFCFLSSESCQYQADWSRRTNMFGLCESSSFIGYNENGQSITTHLLGRSNAGSSWITYRIRLYRCNTVNN